MKLNDFEKKYVFTTKVYLDDEEKDFIEIREPTFIEYQRLNDDGTHNMEVLKEILPACIVNSSIVNDDGTPAAGKDVCNEIYKSGTLTSRVLTDWVNACPFPKAAKSSRK